MLDCTTSLEDHSESQKCTELSILEWKQIPSLGLAFNLIIHLPISPGSCKSSFKCQSPTPNMLKPKDPKCLARD